MAVEDEDGVRMNGWHHGFGLRVIHTDGDEPVPGAAIGSTACGEVMKQARR